jgi:hypothetical protein
MNKLGWTIHSVPKVRGNLFTDVAGTKYITRYDVAQDQLRELALMASHFALPCWDQQSKTLRRVVDCVCSIGGNTVAFGTRRI